MSRYESLRQNEEIVLQRTRKFLRENKFFISEKGIKQTKTPLEAGVSKFNSFVENQWPSDNTIATAVLETLPLLFMLNPNLSSIEEINNLIKKESNRDWHVKAVEWFMGFSKSLSKEIEKYSEGLSNKDKSSLVKDVNGRIIGSFFKKIQKNGNETLTDILGEDPTDFIHGSIDEFHRVFGTGPDKSTDVKKFTADIVLIYGKRKNQILGLSGDATKFTVDGDAAILSDGSTKIVPVSLKANGRIGKIGGLETIFDKYIQKLASTDSRQPKKTKNKFGRSEYEPIDTITGESVVRDWTKSILEEGIFDDPFGTLKDFWSDVKSYAKPKLERMKQAFLFVKNWFKDIFQSLKDVFDNFIQDGEKENAKQNRAEIIIEEMLNELETIEEGKADTMTAPIQIKDCFREKLKKLGSELGYQGVESDFDNIQEEIDKLARKANLYSKKTDLFKFAYPDKDKPFIPPGKHFKSLDDLATLYNKIMDAKVITISGPKKGKTCLQLDVKIDKDKLTRDSIKTFLWQYANMRSARLINKFVDNIIKAVLQKETDNKKVRDFLIQLCVDINAESVFGNSKGLPLVKYDTGVIKRLGQRNNYIEDKVVKIAKSFNKENAPPIIALKIYRTTAKDYGHGEQFAFFQIKLFVLVDIDVDETTVNEIPDTAFSYGALNFKNNQGTEFAFVMEIDTEMDGSAVLRELGTQ